MIRPTLLALVFVFMYVTEHGYAQSWLYPESIVSLTPLLDTAQVSSITFLPSFQFWGEFGYFVMDRDNDHRWDVSIGGTSRLLAGDDWDIIHETNLHLVVDPNNNLSFNPRAIMWETGILLGMRSGATVFQFGYQHRCKHDIDNVEVHRTTGREEERAMIYGSAMVRWRHEAIPAFGGLLDPLLELHYYIQRQDQRFPEWTRALQPLVTGYIGAMRLRGCVTIPVASSMQVGITADVRATLLGNDDVNRFSSLQPVRLEPALEAFWEVRGLAGNMCLYTRYVYMPDDFVPPIPHDSRLQTIGIRIYPR